MSYPGNGYQGSQPYGAPQQPYGAAPNQGYNPYANGAPQMPHAAPSPGAYNPQGQYNGPQQPPQGQYNGPQQPPQNNGCHQGHNHSQHQQQPAPGMGALAQGYPNAPWTCPACTSVNMTADRLFCESCDSRRPPLNVQLENFRNRNKQYYFGSSGWDKYDYNKYDPNNPEGAVKAYATPIATSSSGVVTPEDTKDVEMTAPVNGVAPEANTTGDAAEPAKPVAGQHTDTVGVMGLSQEFVQRVLSTGLALYNVYKAVMACLLAIMVPQACTDETTGITSDCTITENFQELDNFNIAVVVINFVTLAFSLGHAALVYRREALFLRMLDEDPSVTNNFLVKVDERGRRIMDLYPRVRDTVVKYNTLVMFTSTATLVLYFVNVIVSAILVFGFWYAGFRTVTVFLTNMALNLSIIFSHWTKSRQGVKTGVALSMYKSDPSVYNNIDRKNRSKYFVKREVANVYETDDAKIK